MPRFVILQHTLPPEAGRSLHWDLMLEVGQRLRTWALDALPSPGDLIVARPLADHRLAYLEYQGPVSGDRGEVRQWDSGQYEIRHESSSQLVVGLRGMRLVGQMVFNVDALPDQRWTLCFEPAGPFAV